MGRGTSKTSAGRARAPLAGTPAATVDWSRWIRALGKQGRRAREGSWNGSVDAGTGGVSSARERRASQSARGRMIGS